MIAKSVSIKDAGGKSGGRVSKAVELIAGDLLHVLDLRLRIATGELFRLRDYAAGDACRSRGCRSIGNGVNND